MQANAIAYRNQQTVLSAVKIVNTKDITSFDSIYAKNLTIFAAGSTKPIVGRHAGRRWVEEFLRTFPDLKVKVTFLFSNCEADVFSYQYIAQGTQANGFMGLKPTNRPFSFTGTTTVKLNREGKIYLSVSFWDNAAILNQLEGQPPLSAEADSIDQCNLIHSSHHPGFIEEVLIGEIADLNIQATDTKDDFGGKFRFLPLNESTCNIEDGFMRGKFHTIPLSSIQNTPYSKFPINGIFSAILELNQQDSIFFTGPNIRVQLSNPETSDDALFNVSMGLITGGTGRYEGVSGINTVASRAFVPTEDLRERKKGIKFESNDIMVFRVIKTVGHRRQFIEIPSTSPEYVLGSAQNLLPGETRQKIAPQRHSGDLPSPRSDEISIVGSAQETAVVGTHNGQSYLKVNGKMIDQQGRNLGFYKGVGVLNDFKVDELLKPPVVPRGSIEDPSDIPMIPIVDHLKVTFHFSSSDSLTVTGLGSVQIIPNNATHLTFAISAMGLVVQGTGNFEGTRGVQSATATALIPRNFVFQPGASIHFTTLFSFRVFPGERRRHTTFELSHENSMFQQLPGLNKVES